MLIQSPEFNSYFQFDAGFTPRFLAMPGNQFVDSVLQAVEIQGVLKIVAGTKMSAELLVIHCWISTEDQNRSIASENERRKRLAQLESGEIGHQEIQKNAVRLEFQRQRNSFCGIGRRDNLVLPAQTRRYERSHGVVIIDQQNSCHGILTLI